MENIGSILKNPDNKRSDLLTDFINIQLSKDLKDFSPSPAKPRLRSNVSILNANNIVIFWLYIFRSRK